MGAKKLSVTAVLAIGADVTKREGKTGIGRRRISWFGMNIPNISNKMKLSSMVANILNR